MRRKPSPEDIELFRRTVGQVTPLGHDRHVPAPRRRGLRARQKEAARLAALDASLTSAAAGGQADVDVSLGEPLSYRRPGVQDAVLRRLRRGEYGVEAELDLHGLTIAQATGALRIFLATALARRVRCVRIIHGKGLRSGHGGPVLKAFVSSALRQAPGVVAFVSARPEDGGTGATLVLLS